MSSDGGLALIRREWQIECLCEFERPAIASARHALERQFCAFQNDTYVRLVFRRCRYKRKMIVLLVRLITQKLAEIYTVHKKFRGSTNL